MRTMTDTVNVCLNVRLQVLTEWWQLQGVAIQVSNGRCSLPSTSAPPYLPISLSALLRLTVGAI